MRMLNGISATAKAIKNASNKKKERSKTSWEKDKKKKREYRVEYEEEKEFEKLLIECHVRQTKSTDGHFWMNF